ncbi:MAG: hypothetical protein ACLP01_16705 [Solirubrobacteraceae bacterium]
MSDTVNQPELPHLKAETMIVDQSGQTLAIVDTLLWPPINAKVELGQPNRDAVVREVRLRLFPEHASIFIRIEDLGEVVPGGGQ